MRECEPSQRRSRVLAVLKTVVTGFLIGIGAIAPGISGGAIAVVFGLYQKITDCIANFFKNTVEKVKFLVPLLLGAGAGILLFSQVIDYLFANYNVPVRWLFIGLMVGTLPSLIRTSNQKGFRWWYLLPMAGCIGLTVMLGWLESTAFTAPETGLNFWILLVCGMVLGFGTIVPGVSSSFLLMSAGVYQPVLRILTGFDIVGMIALGIGFVGFVVLFAKLINWLYKVAYGLVSYMVTGLLIGSIFLVVPPLSWSLQTFLSVGMAIVGALLSWYLLHIKEK